MKNPELDKHILMHFGIKNMRWGHRKGIGTPARTRKGRKRVENKKRNKDKCNKQKTVMNMIDMKLYEQDIEYSDLNA